MKRNILVVEDDFILRMVVKRSLKRSDLSIGAIFEAGNGREALGLLKKNDINLLVTDINMPVMDGMEMLDRMHKIPLLSHIPVIVISAENSAERIRIFESRGYVFMRKPLSLEAMNKEIKKLDDDGYGYSLHG